MSDKMVFRALPTLISLTLLYTVEFQQKSFFLNLYIILTPGSPTNWTCRSHT